MQKVDLQKQRKKKREKHAKRKNLFFALFFSFTPSHTVLKMDFFVKKKEYTAHLRAAKKTKLTRKICIFLGFCKIVGILYLEVKKACVLQMYKENTRSLFFIFLLFLITTTLFDAQTNSAKYRKNL